MELVDVPASLMALALARVLKWMLPGVRDDVNPGENMKEHNKNLKKVVLSTGLRLKKCDFGVR